jgi:Rod binding domain-containing protein
VIISSPSDGYRAVAAAGGNSPQMAEAARNLEARFIAEMLKSAGFGEQENSFSGGPAAGQFASFQRQAIADDMARNGGIGLAEHILKSMMEASNDTSVPPERG